MPVWLSHASGVTLDKVELQSPEGVWITRYQLTTPRVPDGRVFSDVRDAVTAFKSEVAFYTV